MKGKSNKLKKKKVSVGDYQDALIKKALGYDSTEVVEEYVSNEEGEIKLTKKKVTIKNVPPDITALKILLTSDDKNSVTMTDEELEEEISRLIKLVGEEKNK